ncbi:MAG TPA: alpha/beta hydrolase [Myxococcales bacterium]|nr:alpha/beta hydrolase [Myxococcales bacterium]
MVRSGGSVPDSQSGAQQTEALKAPQAQISEGFFSATDGLRLFWHSVQPASPVAHIALVHGYAEHLGRYQEVTHALISAGYAVHLLDCRGHGQSGGKRAHVENFGEYLSDLDLFLARVNEAAKGAPVFLMGHSHGCLISARYLLDKPHAVRAALFSAPYFRLKLAVSPVKIWAGKLIGKLMPSLPMKNALTVEALTRDVAIQNATKADPLYQQIATPRWFTESTAAQETVMRRATEFVTPFIVMTGTADGIADPAAAREFYEAATSKDKQIKEYPGLLHEIFHEPERDLVFRDVLAWLDERAKAPLKAAK